MIARVLGLNLKRRVIIAVSLLVTACSSVLGIEERRLDTADTYPAEGYAGCTPTGECGACLPVHRAECEARSACGAEGELGECATCVCSNCLEPLVDCRADAGCAAIWQCLEQTRCDLSEGSPGSCAQACGSVVQQNGGVGGEAFQAAVAVRGCAIASSCFSCLPVASAPPESCRRANGCSDCETCLTGCLCGDGSFAECRTFCDGATTTPDECTPGSCDSCGDCVLTCTCQGFEYEECQAGCHADTCTLEASCECGGECLAQCLCNGGDETVCEESCGPPPPPDLCREGGDSGNSGSGQSGSGSSGSGEGQCGGCSGCLAKCTCDGTPLEVCMGECDMLSCCEGQTCAPATSCACVPGSSTDECARENGICGSVNNACDECPCDNCPGKYALCQETSGCSAIFECMRSSDCQGSACVARCAGASEGVENEVAFSVAEALWACTQAAECTCSVEPNPGSVTCGTTVCSDFVSTNATFPACCPTSTSGEPVERTQGAEQVPDGLCGLNLSEHYPAKACLPMGQGNPPFQDLICPDTRVVGPVYNGATLRGCCRAYDGICGFWDDITGLGCLHPGTFITDPTPQNCGLVIGR